MGEPLFDSPPPAERSWLLRALRGETVGGLLLLIGALLALLWANSPWGDAYASLVAWTIGPEELHLNLSLGTWAADGLLAVFFFVAGLELKHELVHGTLSRLSQAVVPVAAALGGMVVPAAIFAVIVSQSTNPSAATGWGIPMATDIAFALAVLAVVGRALPVALRAFLLTLAVVDDLGAIIVIAVFYPTGFHVWPFVGAIACLAIYWFAQKQRIRTPFLYVPLALITWWLMHTSGVHATVAGVALALLTRTRTDPGEERSPADRLQSMLLPLSAGLCVPLFAFLAAGVDLRSIGLIEAITTPVGIAVIIGLVVGKPIGVFGGAWVTARFTRASLSPEIRWKDVAAVGLLAGIGFTVALLVCELAYPASVANLASGKAAVLTASVIAALLASIVLLARNRHYRSQAFD
jgi:NhaA family Na+:H+ antiporter